MSENNHARIDFINGITPNHLMLLVTFNGHLNRFNVLNSEWEDFWDSVVDEDGKTMMDINMHYEEGMDEPSVALYPIKEDNTTDTENFTRIDTTIIGTPEEFENNIIWEKGEELRINKFNLKYGGQNYVVVIKNQELSAIVGLMSNKKLETPQEVQDYVHGKLDYLLRQL